MLTLISQEKTIVQVKFGRIRIRVPVRATVPDPLFLEGRIGFRIGIIFIGSATLTGLGYLQY